MGMRDGGAACVKTTPMTGVSPYVRLTGEPYGYSVVYLECIRDDEFGVGREDRDPPSGRFQNATQAAFHRNRLLAWTYGIIAHELGHAPGRQGENADHNERGLMIKGAVPISDDQPFEPVTLRRFRSALSWTR